MIIDSHCHLDLIHNKTQEDVSLIIQKAKDVGVGKILTINVDKNSVNSVLEYAQTYDDIYASIGVHPCSSVENDIDYEQLVKFAHNEKVIAIGECGLDYYHKSDEATKKIQHYRFENNIEVANLLKKPLIIHTRDAREDTINFLKQKSKVIGILHCFTENYEMAKKALDLGFYISFSGIVTFKSANEIREVIKKIPLDRLLIETDAPYLAPIPYRGQTNYPAYVADTGTFIADFLGVDKEEFFQITTNNFCRLFQINQ